MYASTVARRLLTSSCRPCSTSSSSSSQSASAYFRTSESDPTKHDRKHLGRLYRIPDDLLARSTASATLKADPFLPHQFGRLGKILDEHCVLVRSPALDVIDCVRQLDGMDGGHPAARFVLHGGPGCGKTITYLHALHALIASPDRVVVNFGDFSRWTKRHLQVGLFFMQDCRCPSLVKIC